MRRLSPPAELAWAIGIQTFRDIRLSFAEGLLQGRAELGARIRDLLRINGEGLSVDLPADMDIAGSFGELIGIEVSRERRTVVGFEVETRTAAQDG